MKEFYKKHVNWVVWLDFVLCMLNVAIAVIGFVSGEGVSLMTWLAIVFLGGMTIWMMVVNGKVYDRRQARLAEVSQWERKWTLQRDIEALERQNNIASDEE